MKSYTQTIIGTPSEPYGGVLLFKNHAHSAWLKCQVRLAGSAGLVGDAQLSIVGTDHDYLLTVTDAGSTQDFRAFSVTPVVASGNSGYVSFQLEILGTLSSGTVTAEIYVETDDRHALQGNTSSDHSSEVRIGVIDA